MVWGSKQNEERYQLSEMILEFNSLTKELSRIKGMDGNRVEMASQCKLERAPYILLVNLVRLDNCKFAGLLSKAWKLAKS